MTQQASGHGESGAGQGGAQSGEPLAAQRRDEPTMTDPVCGKPVPLSAPHTFVFNGALFCFCGAECWAQFQVEPARYVRLEAAAVRPSPDSALAGATPAGAVATTAVGAPESPAAGTPVLQRWPVPVATPAADSALADTPPMHSDDDIPTQRLPRLVSAPIPPPTPTPKRTPSPLPTPMTNVIAVFAEKHGSTIDTADDRALATAAAAQDAAAATERVPPQRAPSDARVATVSASSQHRLTASHEKGVLERARELLATPLALWHQSRHAAAVSRQLLKLHSFVAERHPDLKGRALYRQIVMVRSGADTVSADRLLNRAEQSFAQWPAQRDLRFADVVHYLAVEEFFAAHGETHWTQAHMGRVVAARIPSEL